MGLHGCDFRPHFDGYLHNLFTTIHPLQTESETEQLFRSTAIGMAKWVLSNREQFGPGDRFQLIVGWPLDVRATGSRSLRLAVTTIQFKQLIDDQELVQVRKRWAESVFTNNEIG